MQRTDRAEQRTSERATGDPRPRSWRLVPPAVTPLRAADIGAGLLGQARGQGRDRFRRAIESSLEAVGSATYTSFRRTLGACLLEMAERSPGNSTRVLVPAFSSPDFTDAIEGVGLDPVRYDVDPDSLSAALPVDEGLEEDPLALIAVNVLGYSSPMDELATRCESTGAYLIEALGYALGTSYRGRSLGTFGDCAVLNFQQGKPVPVGGGMVVNRNASLSFSDAGRPSVGLNAGALAGYAAFSRPRPYYLYHELKAALNSRGMAAPSTTHPEPKFDVAYSPPFATLSNFQGTIGYRVLDRLDAHRSHRRATARFYATELGDVDGVTHLTPVEGLTDLQYVRYPLLFDTAAVRDRVQNALATAGIQATTLYDWPVLDPEAFPGAARLQKGILTLPTHPYVDERDRRQVVTTVRSEVTAARNAS